MTKLTSEQMQEKLKQDAKDRDERGDLNDENLLGVRYDEVQDWRKNFCDQFKTKKPTVSGKELLKLVFDPIDEEINAHAMDESKYYEDGSRPTPEHVEDQKNAFKEWIESSVLVNDLSPLGNQGQGNFANYIFSCVQIFPWFKKREILEGLEKRKITVDERMRELVDFHVKNESEKQAEPQETTVEPLKQKKNLGGNPGVDPDGKIAEKIKELQSAGVPDDDIPWELRFTKFVQNLKKDKSKIDTEYFNKQVPRRVKKADYTKAVGISLDTVEKIIKNSSN